MNRTNKRYPGISSRTEDSVALSDSVLKLGMCKDASAFNRDKDCNRELYPGDDMNEDRAFGAPSLWNMEYTVPVSALMEISDRNRFRYFSIGCPICGKGISGRPAEYPYYRKFGERVAFLCDFCDELGRICLRE